MKCETLVKHIRNILHLVFEKEAESITIEIFDSNNVNSLYLSIVQNYVFESLIVLSLDKSILDVKDKAEKLSKLLGKNLKLFEERDNSKIYWLDGFQATTQIEEHQSDDENDLPIEKLKSETRLPNWCDKFIFEKLNAKYEPDYKKFDYNIEHSADELLIYLGTYFPRSYAESFCIYEDLFTNNVILSELANKREINILDIGCGTGGNLIGLLTAYNKRFPSGHTINIWAIDGNREALKMLNQIIERFKQDSNIKITYNLISAKFTNIEELRIITQKIPCQSFNFIMSFKTICEIISKGDGMCNNSYYEIIELACQMLSNDGLFLLLDVTIKTTHSDYLPILFNEQARSFTKRNNDFKILAPLSCNCYADICNNHCFYQHDFFVSHKQKSNDVSRVVYKIIGRTNFVENVTKDLKVGKFVVNWKAFNNELKNNGCCLNSKSKASYLDAFKIS